MEKWNVYILISNPFNVKIKTQVFVSVSVWTIIIKWLRKNSFLISINKYVNTGVSHYAFFALSRQKRQTKWHVLLKSSQQLCQPRCDTIGYLVYPIALSKPHTCHPN